MVSSKCVDRFLVERGESAAGEGSFSPFVRCSGLDVGPDFESWILLLLRKLLERFTSSVEEVGEVSPTCMLDLTYRRGTLKKVATGLCGGGEEGREDEGRTIGGSRRPANILNVIDEVVHIMKAFEFRFHCPKYRKGAMLDEPSDILSCFEIDMRERTRCIALWLLVGSDPVDQCSRQMRLALGVCFLCSCHVQKRPRTAPRHSSIPAPTMQGVNNARAPRGSWFRKGNIASSPTPTRRSNVRTLIVLCCSLLGQVLNHVSSMLRLQFEEVSGFKRLLICLSCF